MKAKVKVEFPCGYKYYLDVEFGVLSMGTVSTDGEPPEECPLHGKDCPPNLKKKGASMPKKRKK